MISRELAKYESWLVKSKATVVRFLQAGLSTDELAKHKPEGLSGFDTIAPLYQWHDGIVVSSEVTILETYLLPGWVFMPLREAEERWKTCVDEGLWEEQCFPLFASDAGDYLIWNSLNGHVYCFLREEPDVHVIYDTLDSMMLTANRCVDEGVFFVGDEGLVDCLWEREAILARELNPGASFWQSKSAD